MTLLIVLAAPWAIHQSSDYRLTPLNPAQIPGPNDMAGSKQLTLNARGFVAQISFTGIAQVGKLKTREWISQIIADASEPTEFASIISEIAVRGTQAVKRLPLQHRMLTVIIAIAEHGRNPRLVIVSNVERLNGPRRARPTEKLEVFSLTPVRPMVRSFGCDIGLCRNSRRYLVNLLRNNEDAGTIKKALAAANSSAGRSPKSKGLISEGCMVSSLLADGTASAINFGGVAGIPDAFMGNINVGDLLRKNLQPAPGKQITLVQSASASRVGDKGSVELLPEGEPRTLHFSTPTSEMFNITNRFGRQFGNLTLVGQSGSLAIRKNQPVTTIFNTITWEVGSDAHDLNEVAMFPMFKITNLPTVEGAQPRTWEYGFDVTAKQNVHTLTIRQNSMAFRSANHEKPLPILSPTEELVMVAPKNGLRLSVSAADRSITGTIEAEFLLRDFPELGPATSRAISVTLPKGAPPRPASRFGSGKKVGRNDPCPCGSGKKFKKCHG